MFESIWNSIFSEKEKNSLSNTDSLRDNTCENIVTESGVDVNKVIYLENDRIISQYGNYKNTYLKLLLSSNDYLVEIFSGKYNSKKTVQDLDIFIIDDIDKVVPFDRGKILFYFNNNRTISANFIINKNPAKYSSVAISINKSRLILTIYYDESKQNYKITKAVFYPLI